MSGFCDRSAVCVRFLFRPVRCLASSVCTTLLTVFLSFLVQTDISADPAKKWRAWWELGGYYGTDNASRGEAALFLPLGQSDTALLFADLRGKLFERDVEEGNLALGFRTTRSSGVNLGIWGGFDYRNSTFGNAFPQVSGGIEALTERFDFRANGYWPTVQDELASRSTTFAGGPATVGLAGTQVVTTSLLTSTTTTTRELALHGFDAEVGMRLFGNERANVRVYGGGFWFDHSDFSGEVAGPKARIEFRVEDIIRALPGSRLTLEGEVSHDDVRDDKWEVGARLRLPFGGPGDDLPGPVSLSPLERRMTESLERDTDIVTGADTQVTQVSQAVSQQLTDAGSGEQLNVFHVADTAQGTGDCSSPGNACTTATALGLAGTGDSFVPVDVAGTIAASLAFNAARQQAIGGGDTGNATLTLSDAGASALTLTGLGGRATLNGTLTLFQANAVAGFDINNAGGDALLVSSDVGMTGNAVSDMTISGSGSGVHFTGTSAGMVTFASSVTVNGTAGGAAFRVEGGSASATYSGNIDQAQNNFVVNVDGDHTGTLTFDTGTITATNGSGIQFTNADGRYTFAGAVSLSDPGASDTNLSITNSGGRFLFSDLTVTSAANSGIIITNANDTRVTDVTFSNANVSDAGSFGMFMSAGADALVRVSISNSTLDNPGDGFSAIEARSSGATIHLTATDNVITNAPADGIVVRPDSGGAVACLDASGNSNGAGGPPDSAVGSFAFVLNEQPAATLRVAQSSAAALGVANNGGAGDVSIPTFAVDFGVGCALPVAP